MPWGTEFLALCGSWSFGSAACTQNVKACGLLIIAASGVNDDKTDVYLNDQQSKCAVNGRGGTYERWGGQ